jgi:hypothetical protein
MPEINKFLLGFNLLVGNKYADYTIVNIDAKHNVLINYHKYSYDINLTLAKPKDSNGNKNYTLNKMFLDLGQSLVGTRIIYGIRNPYQCFFEPPSFNNIVENPDNTVTIKLKAYAVR